MRLKRLKMAFMTITKEKLQMQQKSIVQYAAKFFKKLCNLTIEMWDCVWYYIGTVKNRRPIK